jgi:flagellar basal-body rod protein FlgC
MNFLTGIQATASALNAEKVRMDLVAQNIANAHTTRDTDGQAFRRKVVTFEAVLDGTSGPRGVKIGQITTDPNPGELVYQPQHPHANADGYVQMPNVNVAMEMVDLLTASRAYEANLAVARNSRQMAAKALTIGR